MIGTQILQQAIKQEEWDIVSLQKIQTSDTHFPAQAVNAINLQPYLIVIYVTIRLKARIIRAFIFQYFHFKSVDW